MAFQYAIEPEPDVGALRSPLDDPWLIWNIESSDVAADFERFKAAGARVIREPYSFEDAPDAWIATFADPDDNYFQLMSPMGPPER